MTKPCGNDPTAVLVGWMYERCGRTQAGAVSLLEIGEGHMVSRLYCNKIMSAPDQTHIMRLH